MTEALLPPLDEQILETFKRALSEGRSDVAEHLLQALEALEQNRAPGTSVAAAYLAISDRTIESKTAKKRIR